MQRGSKDRAGAITFKSGVFNVYYAATDVNLGFLSDVDNAVNLARGEELSTDGYVVRLRGGEHHAPQIQGAIKRGFLTTDPDAEYVPLPAFTHMSAAEPNEQGNHYKVPLDYTNIINVDHLQVGNRGKQKGNVSVNYISESDPQEDFDPKLTEEFQQFLAWREQQQKKSSTAAPPKSSEPKK